MKKGSLFATLFAGVVAQTAFEPADFNITEALLDNGVNISAIPSLTPSGEQSLLSRCSAACTSLNAIFGDGLVEAKSESAYTAFVTNFWSAQQREISPQCIFKPEKALDVSTAILLARLTQCPFAARSGGHSAVPGGSNIEGGLTISFENMSKFAVSSDKKIVSFQPGHTWFDIYTALEKDNLTVIGGRVASVGVGGLPLGGGISYFSSEYGLACDNVESYELVTASGVIITVSSTSFPDLYWALRGGGNNFGLVTQFNLQAVARAPTMWGGVRAYTDTQFPALIKAYYNLGMNANKDGKAHQILSFGWEGTPVANVELEYADPNPNATILAEYNAIPGARSDQTGIRSLSEVAALLDGSSGPGLRQAFWTWTVKLDVEMATVTKDIFFEEVTSILDAADLVAAVSLQVLTDPILEKTKMRGGNALGLDSNDGPLMLVLVSLKWSDSADDSRINRFAAKIKDRAIAAATAKGKANDYLFMNYASPYQDPVTSYGSANQARLKAISKKYDPAGVFETLQPGYFKLEGTPSGTAL
ncbi:hypothetical protein NX059_001062 [Plenodomus lindquistii]|nr:hypothetical protein NX059_001062 [Plenodomus lindquistii]